jgi:predicted dehydrogenase
VRQETREEAVTRANVHRIGIVMNGVTGRMGTNQHLMRSIVAIMKQGGVRLADGDTIMPDPILVGRNPTKLGEVSKRSGVARWTTDLDGALSDPTTLVYFDAQTTDRRVASVTKAIEAGKHIYCEKPTALTAAEAVELYRLAQKKGVKHGVVNDKLWLPGIRKLKALKDSGFFGEVFSVRGEFGYWVFPGDTVPAQRPSWNYRTETGGGIILDMFCHWRYVLDHVIAPVRSVFCTAAVHLKQRWDESGTPYTPNAEDAAYATFELEGGIVAHFNSSWVVRVRRDDLLTIQVDGAGGSACAGLRRCFMQAAGDTPRPVWNPDIENPIDFFAGWREVPAAGEYENAFKAQWELFLRHVVKDEPFPWNLREGAKGVQLAEKGMESWKKGTRIEIPDLDAAP